MKHSLFFLFSLMAFGSQVQGQTTDVVRCDTIYNTYYTAIWKITTTDTFAVATIAPVEISNVCTNRSKKRSLDKLERKVQKVYPYAKAAGDVMRKYELLFAQITDPKEQKKLLDKAEDEIKKQFEKDIRSMTMSEGVILVKLIDRETGNTSYKLLQDFRGKMSAFMWQGVARIFGQNLKDNYDPMGEDVMIENIVQRIEDGTIPVALKNVPMSAMLGK